MKNTKHKTINKYTDGGPAGGGKRRQNDKKKYKNT